MKSMVDSDPSDLHLEVHEGVDEQVAQFVMLMKAAIEKERLPPYEAHGMASMSDVGVLEWNRDYRPPTTRKLTNEKNRIPRRKEHLI